MDAKPLLLTMGDACGIGPEVIVKAFRSGQCRGGLVLGDLGVMRRAVDLTGGLFPVALIEQPADALRCPPGCLPLLAAREMPHGLMDAPLGRVDARAGAAAAACIGQAVALALAGEVAAIVTAPIHKEALSAAGIAFAGHTEMLQALSDAGPVRMMLANDELRTVLVTTHVSLRNAVELVTHDAVLQTLRIAHRAAACWGQPAPRIGVAGLNPHAGEGGLFGDEEIRVIAPAIAAARAEGIDARGPFAPDTVFMRARHTATRPGEFDLVVAMTHDHGLIPVKYLGLEQGVNVTLGLPFVRTSPDHGTAFDIAGSGTADPASLLAAVRTARRMAREGGSGAAQ